MSNGVNYLGYCHNSVLVLLSSSFVDILGAVFGKIFKTISGTFLDTLGHYQNFFLTEALDQSSFDLVFMNFQMRLYMCIGHIVGLFNQSFPTIFCLAYIKVAGEKPIQEIPPSFSSHTLNLIKVSLTNLNLPSVYFSILLICQRLVS